MLLMLDVEAVREWVITNIPAKYSAVCTRQAFPARELPAAAVSPRPRDRFAEPHDSRRVMSGTASVHVDIAFSCEIFGRPREIS